MYSETYFTFRDRFYKTTPGVAMANPISSLLSEIFMKKEMAFLATMLIYSQSSLPEGNLLV